MIYNLVQLLRVQFPTVPIYANTRAGAVEDRHLLVFESGGAEKPHILYNTSTYQLFARDVDAPKARQLAFDVFHFLTSRFGLILPQATVDAVVYPQIQTAQISAIQVPYNLGQDDEGRTEYVCNYQIIWKR